MSNIHIHTLNEIDQISLKSGVDCLKARPVEFTPIFHSVNSFDCWYGWQKTIFGAKLYSNNYNTDILMLKLSKLFTEWKMGKPDLSDLKANQADELAHSSFAFPLVPNTYCCYYTYFQEA